MAISLHRHPGDGGTQMNAAIEVFKKADAANKKYVRNCRKAEWLEATKQEPQAFLVYADQLERMRVEADEAHAEWMRVCATLAPEQVVSVISAGLQ